MANKSKQIVSLVVGLVVAGIVLGYVFPVGMTGYHDANTTGWTSAEQSLWSIIGIFLILVAVIAIMGWAIASLRNR